MLEERIIYVIARTLFWVIQLMNCMRYYKRMPSILKWMILLKVLLMRS